MACSYAITCFGSATVIVSLSCDVAMASANELCCPLILSTPPLALELCTDKQDFVKKN